MASTVRTNRGWWMALCMACAALAAPCASADVLDVQYLHPAGGQRGKTVTVEVGGKFERWPVTCHVDREGVEAVALEEKGKLQVTVSPGAVGGVYQVRLDDGQATSLPRAFAVSNLAEVVEREPNNALSEAHRLSKPQTVVNGRLRKTGDVDAFGVALRGGQTLVAAVDANRTLGSPMDAVLQIVSADGFVLAQNDDAQGLDPRIVFTPDDDGAYFVRIFGFPATPTNRIDLAGGDSFVYRLTITDGGYVDHVEPAVVTAGTPTRVRLVGWNLPPSAGDCLVTAADDEPAHWFATHGVASAAMVAVERTAALDEQTAADQVFEPPHSVTGRLSQPAETDVYRFAAAKGEKLIVRVDPAGASTLVDPTLEIRDAAGKSIKRVDDTGKSRSAEVAFAPAADGPLSAIVTDLHGRGGIEFAYVMHVERDEPAIDGPVVKIWDQAEHNAFTDLVRFKDAWWCTFRESDAHVGRDGKARVLRSADGVHWTSAAEVAEEGIDLRDPKLSIMPDGRLMLLMGGSVYGGTTVIKGRQPRVAFSDDGRNWSAPQRILDEGEWLWRLSWHGDTGYGISRDTWREKPSDAQPAANDASRAPKADTWGLKLFATRDGVKYDLVTALDVPGNPNEATVRFDAKGRMIALVRREADDRHAWIGVSEAPYKKWTWHDAGMRVGGPEFIVLPSGDMWAMVRRYNNTAATGSGGGAKTVLCRMTLEGLTPVLTLPSGGDTSYAGLVWHDDRLWASYYSSHEGRSSIYLAKIRLPK